MEAGDQQSLCKALLNTAKSGFGHWSSSMEACWFPAPGKGSRACPTPGTGHQNPTPARPRKETPWWARGSHFEPVVLALEELELYLASLGTTVLLLPAYRQGYICFCWSEWVQSSWQAGKHQVWLTWKNTLMNYLPRAVEQMGKEFSHAFPSKHEEPQTLHTSHTHLPSTAAQPGT